MKSNKEILNDFGQLAATEVFDSQYKFIKNDIKDLAMTEGYTKLFENMTLLQKSEIENYTREILKGAIFDFLRIFEENQEYKIVYDEEGKLIDLNKISDMLKAEPIIKNGWIERFSKEL